jgi:phospholipid/cholesterol/gamma-HCH transport system substrate-binding protein
MALGVILVVAILAAIVLVVLAYNNKLGTEVRATVVADRAGLGLNEGAPVALRGIDVGHVREVHLDGDRASIVLGLDPDKAKFIPAGATAEITQPTLFGAKVVDLIAPQQPTAARLQEGATILATSVGTEGNTVLEHLSNVLTKIDVPKLSSGLGALSTALQGRGEKLGNVIVAVNTYLKDFNPSLPKLNDDLASAANVTNIYADFTPDLVGVLDNLSFTSGTLIDKHDDLKTLFHTTVDTSDDTRKLLDDVKHDLHRSLDVLDPTTALLARYSPMFPCLFASANEYRIDFENIVGGVTPGVRVVAEFLPASDGYRYPRDLPKVGAIRTPPSCFGGPIDPKDIPTPHVRFDEGWGGFVTNDELSLNVPLSPTPIPTALPNNLARTGLPTAGLQMVPLTKVPARQPGGGGLLGGSGLGAVRSPR